MIKYVELCVELRKGKMAKDGLIQYRQICQTVNINSLEVVIRHLLLLTNEASEKAQQKADFNPDEIEDLDAEEAAESLLIGGAEGAEKSDLTDREMVFAWLKFLWETYRTVLDVLRLNAKLEPLYQVCSCHSN